MISQETNKPAATVTGKQFLCPWKVCRKGPTPLVKAATGHGLKQTTNRGAAAVQRAQRERGLAPGRPEPPGPDDSVPSLEGLYQSFRKTHGSDLLQKEKQLSKFQPTATTAALLYTQSTLGTRPPCSPEEER